MKRWRVPFPKYGAGPDLLRVQEAALRLGLDLATFSAKSAVITGSNGKGSTAAMCASILNQISCTGLFTSPHLLRFNERFRVGAEDICDAELEHHWSRVAEAAADAPLRGFDFLFLVAADWFHARGCAFVVWEAGIGGRDDPTRLIRPQRTALTSLELEHADLIGPELEDIARNKLDAAPAGARVFVSESCAGAKSVIDAHAAQIGAHVVWTPPLVGEAPLHGAYQRSNAALAAALAQDMAGPAITDDVIARGLAATQWPGRLEVLQSEPLVVIDVGHTPEGVRAALEGFIALAGQRPRTLVCGVSVDKAAAPIIAALSQHFPRIICAAARHKGAAAAEIAQHVAAAHPNAEIVLAENVAEARVLALRHAGKEGAIYVAGGLFLATEFKAAHLGLDPDSLAFF